MILRLEPRSFDFSFLRPLLQYLRKEAERLGVGHILFLGFGMVKLGEQGYSFHEKHLPPAAGTIF